MLTPHILIIGNSLTSTREYLQEHGYSYTTLKDINLTNFAEKHLKHRIVVDFADMQAVLKTVDSIHAKLPIDGIITVYEQFIVPAAAIAHHLNLPALPMDAARACTDKDLMRQKFALAPEKISPDFAVINSEEDLLAFANTHAFPLIIKPANLSKSLLVSKNNSLEQLRENYAKTMATIEDVYKKYAPRATPKLLVEEFMEGSVHSVDAFVDSKGTPHVLDVVVDYQTGHDIGYEDNFHYSRLIPSSLSPEMVAQIKHVATLGCTTLGIKNSPAHIEIILTEAGPRIVEIGARNGGYRDRMHVRANGIDILGNAIRLSLGEEPHITKTRTDSMGVFELFPRHAGIFTGIHNEDKLRELPSLTYLSIKAAVGSFVGSSSDGFKMCAVVMLHHSDPKQFAKDMAFLNNHVAVETIQKS